MKTTVSRLWVLLVVVVCACGTPADAPAPIPAAVPAPQTNGVVRIYSSFPLTGSSKAESQAMVNAITLALEDIGGVARTVGGFRIEYVSLDDATAAKGQWDADQERANAQRAVNDPDAMVYIGTYNSGAAQISIPILNRANMAMISPANTYPGLTRAVAGVTTADEPTKYYPTGARTYFRVVTGDDLQGPADIAFAADTLKATRVFVIDDGQSYGKGLANAVASSAPKRGMTVVGTQSINGREADYRDVARRVRAASPDLIFFGGISQQQPGRILADIRAAGVRTPFLGGDGINNPTFIREAGVVGEGAYSSISGTPTEKRPAKGQDVLKRFQARFGTPTNYTLYAYEAMAVTLQAITTAAKKDRPTVVRAFAQTQNFDGVLGKWSFDASGDTTLTDFAIYQVRDGALTYVQQSRPK